MYSAFIYGLILTFGLILPLGIQNIFVFNQGAAQHSLWRAMPAALTAFFCDSLLIILSVLGVSLVVLSIQWLKFCLYVVGFFFLMYMGWNIWRTATNTKIDGLALSTKKQIFFATSVSILNPHAILDTIGVIGPSSLQFIGREKLLFTLACMSVSFTWFLGLSIAGHFLKKLDTSYMVIGLINKASALIIWSIALGMAYKNLY